LSFNYFSSEDDIRSIHGMPRLTRLLLYGNPVLGPTGEDPLFTYIEDLVEESAKVREEAGSQMPDIEVSPQMHIFHIYFILIFLSLSL
jgi:hypothetical protein